MEYAIGDYVKYLGSVDTFVVRATREDENTKGLVREGFDYAIQKAFDENGPVKESRPIPAFEDDLSRP